jgi:hypothetical protein
MNLDPVIIIVIAAIAGFFYGFGSEMGHDVFAAWRRR